MLILYKYYNPGSSIFFADTHSRHFICNNCLFICFSAQIKNGGQSYKNWVDLKDGETGENKEWRREVVTKYALVKNIQTLIYQFSI